VKPSRVVSKANESGYVDSPVLFDFGSADAMAKLRRDIDRECWLALRVRQPTKIIITDIS
jgi:hypothetical protein